MGACGVPDTVSKLFKQIVSSIAHGKLKACWVVSKRHHWQSWKHLRMLQAALLCPQEKPQLATTEDSTPFITVVSPVPAKKQPVALSRAL